MVEITEKEVELTEDKIDEFLELFKAILIDAFRDTFNPGPHGRANQIHLDYSIKS